MKKILMLIGLLALCGVGQLSAAESVQQKSTGFGSDYQAALTDALLNAVRQVRGLEVGTEKSLRFDLSAIVTEDKAVMSGGSRVETDVYSQTRGWIQSYQVVSVKKPANKDDVWQVEVNATIPKYKQAIAEDQRKRIAVMPFRINPAEFRAEVERDGAADIVVQLADGLTRVFSQTGKMAVLNRAFKRELDRERGLWSSEQVSPQEASRLGETLGADYVLLGNLYKFDLAHKKKEFYGSDMGSQFASIELFYSVVEAATEKVIWSDKRIFSIPVKEGKSLVKEEDPHIVSSVVDQVVNVVAGDILDTMYPIKVMSAETEEQILLNQGKGRLLVGQRLVVYSPATEVTDPDTGFSIKVQGKQLAEIEVREVQPQYSQAALLTGELSAIQKNSVARLQVSQEAKAAPAPRQTPGSSDKPWTW